jgi:glycosyltransferase involved in cell wall biosynthesis
MKKIHVITTYFYPLKGGIENSILETYSRLIKAGYEVIVHTTRDDYKKKNVYEARQDVRGIKIKRYKSTWYSFWPNINWDEAEVVSLHNFNIFPHVLIVLYAFWLKINFNKSFNLILHPHGGFTPRWDDFSGNKKLLKQFYHNTVGKLLVNLLVDKVRAVSSWEKTNLDNMGIKPEIVLVPNGIEDIAFQDIDPLISQDSKNKVAGLGKYIIQIGKVHKSKNHSAVIRVLDKLKEDIKYVIVGEKDDEEYYNELKQLISDLNLEKRVLFVGRIENEKKYYLIKNALALVHLSAYETYGAAVREAMAAGQIVVVNKVTALGTLIGEKEGGFVLKPEKEKDLVETLNFIANDKNSFTLELMRKKAKEIVKDNSWQAVSEKMKELFGAKQEIERSTEKFFKALKKYLPKFLSNINNKKSLFNIFVLSAVFLILFLSLRGLAGNPNEQDLLSSQWSQNGPFESSNERGRFALVYSVVENGSLKFSNELAEFASPDLAKNSNGDFVSLFPPGMAFVVMPGYLLGKLFGLSQFGIYLEIALFALANVLLMYLIARQLKVAKIAAWLGSLSFIFATPSFTYAVSFFQHHVSLFLILAGIYSLLRFSHLRSMLIVFLLCGTSLIIDSANLFNLMPLGIFALFKIFEVNKNEKAYKIVFKPQLLLSFLIILIPLTLYFTYNKYAHDDPVQLSGTLERVTDPDIGIKKDFEDISALTIKEDAGIEKKALSFFETRNLLNGFYTHILSPDRGLVNFAPIVLLGIFGLAVLAGINRYQFSLLFSLIAANLVIYSMWGDPYGGWTFGSRYLIPSYAMLCLGVSVLLQRYRKNLAVILLFMLIFLYSAHINTVGALTSSLNPPKVEVLALEEISGQEEKYTVDRNWDYLEEKGTKSFVYKYVFNDILSPREYYNMVYSLIVLLVLGLGIGHYIFNKRFSRNS